jgi:hypothetical protein
LALKALYPYYAGEVCFTTPLCTDYCGIINHSRKEGYMPITAKRKDDHIKVKQFLTDTKGHKMAAVIDIEEFDRVKTILNLIPSSEVWLYKNKKALESVQKGLRQAAKGKVTKLNLDEL